MTDAIPPAADPNPVSVDHRLLTMRRAVRQLGDLGAVDPARLEESATGLAVERLLALLAELALAVNTTVCEARTGEVPRTLEQSFHAAAGAGLIDADLAAALTPKEGPHHLLVQLCLDSEPEKVGGIVAAAASSYDEYVRRVDAWTVSASRPATPTGLRPPDTRRDRLRARQARPLAGGPGT
ncbi:hypothetical protein GCM10009836_16510 [Pseudonocardia ailaonensis]|uniref:Uncharacterized protein n=1 Tax=Pseudonocardia ailaonensis TaxID=367279 RepID=A0ABN2MV28_9PSEU